jgi:parvulin-like peptidyl-prolyl isomerase
LAKKKAEKPQREFTKPQLSQWQRGRGPRIMFISGIVMIVAALLTPVGVGWYVSQYRPLHETVIKVNNTDFDMGYFIKTLKVYLKGQPSYYMYAIAGQVATVIERNELIKQGAPKLGITVSNDEIKAELIKNNFGNDYWDMVRAQLLVNKLLDYFDKQVPTSAEQRDITAMFLESESQANEVRARLEKGEDFGALAKELSLESVSKEKSGDFGWHPKGVLTELLGTSVPDDYAFSAGKGSLSQPVSDENEIKSVGYWLIKVVKDDTNTDTTKVHVWAMLLSSAEQAQDMKARLEKGEDFATLAKGFSQEPNAQTDGGDFGLVTEDQISKPVAAFAFNSATEPGKISDPIRDDTVNTKGGYWVIKVLDVDSNRQISDDDRTSLKSKALNDWGAGLFTGSTYKIDEFLTTDKITFAVYKATQPSAPPSSTPQPAQTPTPTPAPTPGPTPTPAPPPG